jgi:hypothetical protein
MTRPAKAPPTQAPPSPFLRQTRPTRLAPLDPFDPARLRLDPAVELVGSRDVPAETRGR